MLITVIIIAITCTISFRVGYSKAAQDARSHRSPRVIISQRQKIDPSILRDIEKALEQSQRFGKVNKDI
jgi:hypothetical protein